MLRDIFVDRVAKPLRPRLGRERQAAFSYLLHAKHQVARKIIRAQARKREIDFSRLAVIQQLVCQLRELSVVGR